MPQKDPNELINLKLDFDLELLESPKVPGFSAGTIKDKSSLSKGEKSLGSGGQAKSQEGPLNAAPPKEERRGLLNKSFMAGKKLMPGVPHGHPGPQKRSVFPRAVPQKEPKGAETSKFKADFKSDTIVVKPKDNEGSKKKVKFPKVDPQIVKKKPLYLKELLISSCLLLLMLFVIGVGIFRILSGQGASSASAGEGAPLFTPEAAPPEGTNGPVAAPIVSANPKAPEFVVTVQPTLGVTSIPDKPLPEVLDFSPPEASPEEGSLASLPKIGADPLLVVRTVPLLTPKEEGENILAQTPAGPPIDTGAEDTEEQSLLDSFWEGLEDSTQGGTGGAKDDPNDDRAQLGSASDPFSPRASRGKDKDSKASPQDAPIGDNLPPAAGDGQISEASFAPAQRAGAGELGSVPQGESVNMIVGKLGLGPHNPLTQMELAELLSKGAIALDGGAILEFKGPDGESLYASTTLDPLLQSQALKLVKNAGSLQVALVAIDPIDGRVLALAGNTVTKGARNPALSSHVPAASVFKIVTAGASMERNHYTRRSYVLYDGGKHTLYKSNVVKEPDKGKHKASLEEGFAESINSVFGKLGIYTMLPQDLKAFAELLGFNREIPFDLPLGTSNFSLDDPTDPFLLAELASGYNRTTTISPLHAAMIGASVLNGGIMPEPHLVTQVEDRVMSRVYQRNQNPPLRVMSQTSSKELKALMEATITMGTGRREFWDYKSHPVLRNLTIGGKSGTINDTSGNRVDWFVSFGYLKGKEGTSSHPIAIGALVVHGGSTRTNSKTMTRQLMLAHFEPILKEQGQLPGS